MEYGSFKVTLFNTWYGEVFGGGDIDKLVRL